MVSRPCERCGLERPAQRTRYCSDDCHKAVLKERTRRRDDGRIKPCPRCGGPKERGKRRYCLACREALLPVWQQQEYERSRRRAEVVKARRAAARAERQVTAAATGVTPKVVRESRQGPDGTLRCTSCEEYLPPTAFSTRGRGQLNGYCKPCYSAYSHDRMLRKTYGIDAARYDELLEQQDGRCAICLKRPRTRRLAVDHDHRTGDVRGLLCTRCNHKLLGAANDSVAMLTRAAAYLEAPPALTGASPDDLPDYWEQLVEEAIGEAEDRNADDPSQPPVAVMKREGVEFAAMSVNTLLGLLKQYEQATGLPLTIVVQEESE